MAAPGEIAQGLDAELDEMEEVFDEDEDDDYEDDSGHGDDDEVAGQGAAMPGAQMVPEWATLNRHPEATTSKIRAIFKDLTRKGRNRLSILLIGRTGVGKSHTTNSLFADQVAQVVAFHMVSYTSTQPVVVRKQAHGLTFTVIDTPGLVESDGVSEVSLRRVAFQTRNNPVDVVMYVDRLDMTCDELDLQMFEGINRTFGRDVWSRMLIGITRSDVRAPPPGLTYADVVNRRVESIRDGMRKVGAKEAALPFCLIENSVRCRLNNAGEKTVDGHAWVPALFANAAEIALAHPKSGLRYEEGLAGRKASLVQKFVFIPLVIAAQVLLKMFVIDRIIEDDGTKGDQYGPFDPATVEYERQKLRDRREREKEERAEARRRAAKLQEQSKQRIEGTFGLDDSSDDDDFFDDE